jgi:hypothetical protein
MSSQVIARPQAEMWASQIDAITRLVGWVRPSTNGRSQALATLKELRNAVADVQRFSSTLSRLARDLDEVYPGGAIVSLARRHVRDLLLAVGHRR